MGILHTAFITPNILWPESKRGTRGRIGELTATVTVYRDCTVPWRAGHSLQGLYYAMKSQSLSTGTVLCHEGPVTLYRDCTMLWRAGQSLQGLYCAVKGRSQIAACSDRIFRSDASVIFTSLSRLKWVSGFSVLLFEWLLVGRPPAEVFQAALSANWYTHNWYTHTSHHSVSGKINIWLNPERWCNQWRLAAALHCERDWQSEVKGQVRDGQSTIPSLLT